MQGDDEDKVVTTTTSMRSYMDALKYTYVLMDSDLNMVDEEEPCVINPCCKLFSLTDCRVSDTFKRYVSIECPSPSKTSSQRISISTT